jgi:steroid delta-isomerase-like uncharacterized protein
MSDQNKAVMRRTCEEVWNGRNPDAAGEVVARDFVGHAPPDEIHGPEGYRRYFGGLRKAFPDLHFTIDEQIGEGDRVVTRWTAHGTQEGEFNGIPPTGKKVTITGILIDSVAAGKSVECWTNMDSIGLMQQLGIIPMAGSGEPAAVR